MTAALHRTTGTRTGTPTSPGAPRTGPAVGSAGRGEHRRGPGGRRLTPARRPAHAGAEPRLAALSTVRAFMAGTALLVALLDPAVDADARMRLLGVAGAWALLLLVGEAARRTDVGAPVMAGVAYLLDGVLLVMATLAGGGSSSPLFFLAFIHVIAVTLLVSYLTGLKAALWDSLLLLLAAAAQTAGAIPHLPAGDGSHAAAAAIRTVALLGVTVATVGCSALNERELRRSRAGLETMLATGQALMGARRAEEAIQIALAALTGPLEFVSAACVVGGQVGPPMVASRRQGVETAPVGRDREVRPLHLRAPLLRADPGDLGDPLLEELLGGQANAVAVPLRGERVRGVLACCVGGRPRRRGLPVRSLEMVQSLSDQLVQTLERIDLAEAIAALAASDGLTGVPNRRHFDERFEQLLHTAAATGQPLAILAIDIDHFKHVNDQHGHQVGDEVLQAVARALRDAKRTDDVLARYGGEEFAMLLPVTDLVGAIPLAERLRRAVAAAPSPVPVTVSVGVASTRESGMSASTLFAAADQALYRAKAQGRDCVRASG